MSVARGYFCRSGRGFRPNPQTSSCEKRGAIPRPHTWLIDPYSRGIKIALIVGVIAALAATAIAVNYVTRGVWFAGAARGHSNAPLDRYSLEVATRLPRA